MPDFISGRPAGAAAADLWSTALRGSISLSRVAAREFRVTASGLWTPECVDGHFVQLKQQLGVARGMLGVHVLVDLREAVVQPAATAARVKYWIEDVYRLNDRVAIIVLTHLLMIQMRRVATIAACKIFLSEGSALGMVER